MERIILASGSPRRAELLRMVGCEFDVEKLDVDEPKPSGSPRDAATELARFKCTAAAERFPDRVILAADTLVDLDGEALGKPRDRDDAFRMLRALSGREHLVHTGVAVRSSGKEFFAAETTKVFFRELCDGEIERYVASGEPLDKAGAYGIQARGALLVRRIEGDYSNVVGLPLPLTAELLLKVGVRLI